MRKFLLALGLAFSLIASAQAQTGSECWPVTQGTLPSLCLNNIRNQHANVVLSAITGNFTIGVASANVTVTGTPGLAALATGGNLIITAQPSAAAVTLPANPLPDGTVIGVCNSSAAAFATNAFTLAANTNQTLAQAATLTTLAAGSCAREQWNLSQATWYRIQ